MGQRQSSEERQQQNEETSRRGRTLRPNSRRELQRNDPLRRPNMNNSQRSNSSRSWSNRSDTIPAMASIPVNENERRDERHRRREFLRGRSREREILETDSSTTSLGINNTLSSENTTQSRTTTTTATMTTTEGATISPFSRMIAQVISQAVVTSFRNGQIPVLNSDGTMPSNEHNIRQQLTMHLSSDLFRQIEPENNEDMFIRFIRLPVLVTRMAISSNSTEGSLEPQTQEQSPQPLLFSQEARSTNRTNSYEEERGITRVILLPVFLYGLRTTAASVDSMNRENQEGVPNEQEGDPEANTSPIQEETNETRQEAAERPPHASPPNRHWTIYVIGGNHTENLVSDNPSYEELLNLATLIGTVRSPTVTQEAIDNHLTIEKYTAQVKQTIVGNSEKCQVCLNDFLLDEDVRILTCHHGFHKDCIDQWLIEGQNKCPLCREEVVPRE